MPKRKTKEELENNETLEQTENYEQSEEVPEETPEPLQITTIAPKQSESSSQGVRVLFRLKHANAFKIAIKGSDEYKKLLKQQNFELIKDPLDNKGGF
jgi:hypothetical protein